MLTMFKDIKKGNAASGQYRIMEAILMHEQPKTTKK